MNQRDRSDRRAFRQGVLLGATNPTKWKGPGYGQGVGMGRGVGMGVILRAIKDLDHQNVSVQSGFCVRPTGRGGGGWVGGYEGQQKFVYLKWASHFWLSIQNFIFP